MDRTKIWIKAGDGGNGVISFRREAFIPRGGPDGGNGGEGGSVIIEADPQLHTLLDFHYRNRYRATDGAHGEGARRTGRSGEDIVLRLPLGTRIYEGTQLLADLTVPQQRFTAANGGRGGRGNSEFATSTNRAPRKATHGKPGDERELRLELMLMADVGLVGLPNAGKSTLLSVLTSARPKIAPYPFTTLHPNLGIVRPTEYTSFVLADLPGLIEGAAEGKGLGFEFLRHVERTRVLVYLLDASSEHPRDDLRILKKELKNWNPDLLKRPSLVVLSKSDLNEDSAAKGPWKMRISSADGDGLDKFVQTVWKMLEDAPLPNVFRTVDESSKMPDAEEDV